MINDLADFSHSWHGYYAIEARGSYAGFASCRRWLWRLAVRCTDTDTVDRWRVSTAEVVPASCRWADWRTDRCGPASAPPSSSYTRITRLIFTARRTWNAYTTRCMRWPGVCHPAAYRSYPDRATHSQVVIVEQRHFKWPEGPTNSPFLYILNPFNLWNGLTWS